MSSLANLHLQSNTKIKINFNGGNLSSDAGLLLFHKFVHKLGLNASFQPTENRKGKLSTTITRHMVITH